MGKDIIWSTFGFIFNKGSVFFAILLGSHFLDTADYLQFSIFLLVANIFSGVVGGSLSLMANRYSYKNKLVFSIWLLVLGISLISSIISFSYLYLTNESTNHFITTLVESLYILGTCYITSINGIYYGQNKLKKYATINIYVGILTMIVCGISYYYRLKYIPFISLLGAPLILALIITSIKFFKHKKVLSYPFLKRGLNKVFIPNLISGILFQPAILFTAELIRKYASDQNLISFTVANQFRMVLNTFSIIIGSVIINRLILSNDRRKKNTLNLNISIYPTTAIVVAFILSLDFIILLLDKIDVFTFKATVIVFSITAIITSINTAISRNFVVDEKGRTGIYNNLTWLIIYIILNYLLVPKYSAIGAAVAFLLTSASQFFIWLPYCVKNKYIDRTFLNSSFIFSLILTLTISLISIFNYPFYLNILLSLILFYYISSKIFKLKLRK